MHLCVRGYSNMNCDSWKQSTVCTPAVYLYVLHHCVFFFDAQLGVLIHMFQSTIYILCQSPRE